jgi:hypothetical protein
MATIYIKAQVITECRLNGKIGYQLMSDIGICNQSLKLPRLIHKKKEPEKNRWHRCDRVSDLFWVD